VHFHSIEKALDERAHIILAIKKYMLSWTICAHTSQSMTCGWQGIKMFISIIPQPTHRG